MDAIALRCIDENNEVKIFEFHKESTGISLMHENLRSIDLRPIISCNNLETLDLGFNQFRSIDLYPIGSCRSLRALSLVRNSLQGIDLRPLESCSNLVGLDLSLCYLEKIDLTPLGSCKNLRLLALRQNQLRNIDLSPLSSCAHLNNIDISGNQLQDINLNPLKASHNLGAIYLGFNQLRELDLAPLRKCIKLECLELDHNQLETIDLSPLAACRRISRLCLHDNPLRTVDITFLIFMNQQVWELESIKNASLQTFLTEETFRSHYDHYIPPGVEYNVPNKLTDLEMISRLVRIVRRSEPSWKRILLTQSILSELGLGWLGILDNGIDTVLRMLVNSKDLENFKEKVVPVVLNLVREQIENAGSTIGLIVESMLISREFAEKIERVVELRERELEQTGIVTNGEDVDLTPLWLTAYGYEILTALHFGLKTNVDGLQLVESELRKLHIELGTEKSEKSQPATVISDDFRNYILSIVQSRSSSVIMNESQLNKQMTKDGSITRI